MKKSKESALDCIIAMTAKVIIKEACVVIMKEFVRKYLPVSKHVQKMIKTRNPVQYKMKLIKRSCRVA